MHLYRALRSDQKLDQIAGAVKNLIVAVAMDTGNQGTVIITCLNCMCMTALI